jgi:phosphatidylserine/phosphatidylglycerophosphate/cardiolipin synthase-like enzyme
MNMDNRSSRLNDEAALVIHDSGFGARLDSMFLGDLAYAVEVTLSAYEARPLWQRALERATRLAAPFL